GRRSSSGLMLSDPEVSREHARVDYVPPRYFVRDLQSMNGTVVNGRQIDQPHPLTDGDLIEVGHSRLRFRVGG
ncbi:MAG: FHA domain-containing protein, partial [Dehalococcoidia bacterium]